MLARRRALADPGQGPASPARLDPYEAAYLNGGCELVATTAVSSLLRAGHLADASRRRRRARLVARAAPGTGAHPVEWATYQLVADRPDHPRWALGAELCRAPAMAALGERLRLAGLAPTPEQRTRYRAAGLWFLPLLALGAARVAAGSANGRPVGFLVALLVATVVAAVVLALRVPRATELGRRTLRRLRAETRKPTVGASPAELGMATALFGAGVLWAADTETALAMRLPREHGAFLGGWRRRRRGRELRRGRRLRGRLRRRVRRMTLTGVGIGWRPELAGFAERRHGLGFAEVVAESLHDDQPLPAGLADLLERGVPVIPHGVRLSLGSAEVPDPARVGHLAALAERLGAPLVSEHLAFVRAGGLEAGHLLPVPRTREALDVLTGNVRLAQAELGVPLALEHVAALLEWPAPELDEAAFLTEVLERTGALLLLDLANLHANARNHGGDPLAFLDALPLERIAYVHVAGGVERDGLYHDTHAHPTPPAVLELVAELCSRRDPPGVMLERDDAYPPEAELAAELDAIAAATLLGAARR